MNTHVLVIEPEAEAVSAIKHILDGQECELQFVKSVSQALQKAENSLPDVILLTLIPSDQESDLGVLYALRREDLLKHIPILLLVKEADRKLALAGLEAGAEDYATKPFQPLELQTRLKNLASLHHYRKSAEAGHTLASGYEELTTAYHDTIAGWARAMDFRDRQTQGHTERIMELTLQLARNMGLDGEDLNQIRLGALLHDVGKLGIPDSILHKAGALTPEEWRVIRNHPQYAYEILSPIHYLQTALDIPYCHHEKWDGTGYPRGLKGAEIPLFARIFAVVDVWVSLVTERPYRAAWTEEMGFEYLQAQSRKHFDPQVVDAFCKQMGFKR